ncbi:sugar-binding protein [Paenibacillus sp. J2TS4]|uniref:sugar-binding protein n=1 Tax=Paenibacillus sp. J2TS4 TaxID=2807194 RepID=UPI001B04BA40|nr:sugar-binding protein [Paenibacillus sp. J2TS4]GIP35330.1 LmbE-like protein [Paenibacillus sp. J2TS4]
MFAMTKGRKSIFVSALLALTMVLAPLGGNGMMAAAKSAERPVGLDVLFVGAHPDDEAGSLSTFGQWNEYEGIRTGVITVTRGEGGGNAAGPEEGAALGIIREKEERNAVGKAGIEHIYNLDKLDFYYTVSAPLTEEMWGHDDSLEKAVRIVRMTRPELIVTMNPSPTPGNHGNHQYAARLAVEAFYAAADPDVFPEQIEQEGLKPWRASKLLMRYAAGSGQLGESCDSTFVPTEPTDEVYGVWNGRYSAKHGKTWGQVERDAQREYVTQGWAVFPDVSADGQQLGCDSFTEIDSRVPGLESGTDSEAILAGALKQAEGGLPLGSELYLTTDAFQLVRGQSFNVTAHVLNGGKETLRDAEIRLELPDGWKAEGKGAVAKLEPNEPVSAEFTVTVPDNAELKRVRLNARLTAGDMEGFTSRVVNVSPEVTGTLQPLPQVAQFRNWAQQVGVPQLDNLIKPVLALGVGETRTVEVDVTNYSDRKQNGEVTLQLPEGFKAEPAMRTYSNLQPGATGKVKFQVKNTNPDLKTSNEGGEKGDYNFTVQTTSMGGSSTQAAALNLVPVAEIAKVDAAPRIDGVESPGEYPGVELDLSRVWEGEAPESEADASGSAKVTWYDDALYFVIHVKDDVLGAVLPPDDAKRHWRTDSVEIAIDPRGDSENTSTTFKVGIFPVTDDAQHGNPAAAYRDADHKQGLIAETAPGMVVKSTVSEPYAGYTIEAKIPFADLPAPIDPQRMGLNIFIYDSDTQDKTGQTRLGWSTWGGVQGDPYRWGQVSLAGYDRGKDGAVDVGRSVASPQSILQSIADGVPLAGGRDAGKAVQFQAKPVWQDDSVIVELKAKVAGEAHLFIWADDEALAYRSVRLEPGKTEKLLLPVAKDRANQVQQDGIVLAAFETETGATAALSEPVKKE